MKRAAYRNDRACRLLQAILRFGFGIALCLTGVSSANARNDVYVTEEGASGQVPLYTDRPVNGKSRRIASFEERAPGRTLPARGTTASRVPPLAPLLPVLPRAAANARGAQPAVRKAIGETNSCFVLQASVKPLRNKRRLPKCNLTEADMPSLHG